MSVEVLPAPMSTEDCDLRGLPFMPLDVLDLSRSSLAAKASGDGFRAAVLLWCAAWHQVPAGSLPNDEEELAFLAGFGRDMRSWKRARDWALHKFVLCEDGRLYHPLVSAKAMEVLPSRQVMRDEKASATERKRLEREDRKRMFAELRATGIVPEWSTTTSRLRTMLQAHASNLVDLGGDRDERRDGESEPSRPVTEPGVTGHAQVTAKRETGRGTGTEILDFVDDAGAKIGKSKPDDPGTGLHLLLRSVCDAAGIPMDPSRKGYAEAIVRMREWSEKGYQLEEDIKPAIDRTLQALPAGETIGTVKFIERELFGTRAAAAAKAKAAPGPAKPIDFAKTGEAEEVEAWRQAVAATIGAGPYRQWVDGLTAIVEPDRLVLRAPTSFHADRAEAEYGPQLKRLAGDFLGVRLVSVIAA